MTTNFAVERLPMAKGKREKFTADTLPPVGAAYAIPLADGRYGCARVVATRTPQTAPQAFMREYAVHVVATEFVGSAPPAEDSRGVERLLVGTNGQPRGIWTASPPPPAVRQVDLGDARLPPANVGLSPAYSGWEWLSGVVERELVKRPSLSFQSRLVSAETSLLPATDVHQAINDLAEHWLMTHDRGVVRAVTEVLARLVDELQNVKADRPALIEKVSTVITSLQHLNEHYRFIGTIEREDLSLLFDLIARATGVPGISDIVAERADW